MLTETQITGPLAKVVAARCAGLTAVSLPASLDRHIQDALVEVRGVVQAERCVFLGGSPGEKLAWMLGAADAENRLWSGENSFAARFPYMFAQLCGGQQPLDTVRLEDVPPGEKDWEAAAAMGIRAMLALAVHDADGYSHCLVIQSAHERQWATTDVCLLQELTRAFVNALARQRLAEARKMEAQHVDVLELVGAILWRADARTLQTTFVSREVQAILGYPVEMWINVPGFWRDHIHPDDRAWVESFTAAAIAEHRPHDFEYRMFVADGRVVWLRNIVKVIVEHGQAAALIGVTTDITTRKRAEFDAAQLRHQLTHASRVTVLGELAATLAHELNQPLGAIVSNAETALLDAALHTPPTAGLRSLLQDIERDAQRAAQIVRRVRLMLQRQEPERDWFDLERVTSAVMAIVSPLADSRHIDVKVQLEPGLRLHGDVVQVQQLLLNLLLNAVDAVADEVESRRQIRVDGALHGAAVLLSVHDSGRGIPPEALPRLFEPFFTTRRDGLGMGLAICKTIVEAHGGHIAVANHPAGGASVTLTFPLPDGGRRDE